MALTDYPAGFIAANQASSKLLNIVMLIDGVPTALSMSALYKSARYGDPIFYGDASLVYGGLIAIDPRTFKPLISVDSNLTIGQRLEPEQGKAAISTLTIILVDLAQYVTQLMTPGVIVDEPLGNKFVTIKLGYLNSSYPEDYFTIFRGYIADVMFSQGKYYITIQDPNTKGKGQIYFTPQSVLTGDITSGQTTIPFVTTGYYTPILGPNGAYDSTIQTYLVIGSEIISYLPAGIAPTQITGVTRGARGTTAASAATGDTVNNSIQIQDNFINIALKTYLSGWNGPWISNVAVLNIQDSLTEGIIANAILLPIGKNAVDDYGLVVGDYVTVSGSIVGNNGTKIITDIQSNGQGVNNLILFDSNFVAVESPAPPAVVLAFRSQFDTYPVAAGLQLTPRDVDVATFIYFRDNFFSQGENTLRFYIDAASKGKDWIEAQLMLPPGCYSITRFGRLSMTMARPPIAGSKLPILDKDSVIDPNSIQSARSVNNRQYFNEIKYTYDVEDDNSTFDSTESILDTTSLTQVDIPTVLPIASLGLKTDLNAPIIIKKRGTFLINRYKKGAIIITMKVNFKVGAMIESGDVVLVNDNGDLQITNYESGARNLGSQLFEVIDRQYSMKDGVVTLKLMSGIGFKITDRFATIAPSSIVVAGSTTTKIKFQDSFGAVFPGNEKAKWEPLVGMNVFVHNQDWSNISNDVQLLPFSNLDPYSMNVSPALNYTPGVGDIIEVSFYAVPDPLNQALTKTLYAFLSPSIPITGVSSTVFHVTTPADMAKFTVGLPVIVRSADYSSYSGERNVTVIDNVLNRITVASAYDIPFANMAVADGVGYTDGLGFYRWI
jgi:hypothetical protein